MPLLTDFVLMYILSGSNICLATIDINTSQLKYLADHLTLEECRKLVAAAHFNNYVLPNALSEAELKVTKDLSCFELLLHWNSSPGEGKGRSHEVLGRRLRQLDKKSLADWLGNNAFDQVGKDLTQAVAGELVQDDNETYALEPLAEIPTSKYEDPTDWTPIDSVMFAILFVLIIAIAGMFTISCFIYTMRRLIAYRRRYRSTKYKNIELNDISSSESSENSDGGIETSETDSKLQT